MLLFVFLLCVAPCRLEIQRPSPACNLDLLRAFDDYEYVQDGDIIIGGVFTVNHFMTALETEGDYVNSVMLCLRPMPPYYRYFLTIRFAIDEINKDPTILPNMTLGYHMYDSCADNRKAVKSVLQILSGPGQTVPNYSCRKYGNLAGFIGDQNSVTTVNIAHILALYRYTQVSYGATSDILSNRNTYPTFFRTVQSNQAIFFILSGLLQYFGWTWIGVISSDDDSGNEETQLLTQYLTIKSICVAYMIKIKPGIMSVTENIFRNSIEIIRKSSAQVILLCGTFSSFMADLLKEVSHVLCDKTFVFGPVFASKTFLVEHYREALDGSLAVEFYNLPVPDMKSFYDSFQYEHREKQAYLVNTCRQFHHLQIPKSQCSENCLPGTRKVPRSGIHACCYDCVHCSEGEISNVSDSENCQQCRYDEWPNEKKDRCVLKRLDFLSYSDDLIGMVFASSSSILFAMTGLILLVFISHQDTAIVRANNRNLSFTLLVSIMLSFLCVFFFLGRPADISCLLRQVSFGILFTIAISSILAKTIMVYVVFKASKPGSLLQHWIGTRFTNSVVVLCSSIQVLICIIWLSVSPPFQDLDTSSYQDKIIVQCNEGSAVGFYSVLGYMGFLAAVSFVLAFMVRTLPDSFNEAKYITFSMLVFCSVWIAMIPAYLSTRGKYMVAVEIFTILSSSAGVLGCIFLPKCYIILWRPELNIKSYLLEKRSQ
ncbi:vomeronasal type-2 receptor 26-like [Rana temporaria]|uniref:vomeronasal type-2 receptor 26-like n=1 Tax=Rana temporaria TaxID=8407 RepID=UPI001AAC55F7|nr:vomeronasal type-2 receptor 26-like [Rana temporaria]